MASTGAPFESKRQTPVPRQCLKSSKEKFSNNDKICFIQASWNLLFYVILYKPEHSGLYIIKLRFGYPNVPPPRLNTGGAPGTAFNFVFDPAGVN